MELSTIKKKEETNPLHSSSLESSKVDFDTELITWIKHNRATASLDPRHNDKVFIDESGVRRYEDNWMPASTAAEFNRQHKTGCVEKSISFLYSPKDKNSDSEIRFLIDWKLLWSFLEEDKVDEVAKQLPLFRLFVEFYFHQRTSIFIVVIALYAFFSQLIIDLHFPDVETKSVIAVTGIYYFCEVAVYMSFRFLFKGSFFGETNRIYSKPPPEGEEEAYDEMDNKKDVYVYSLHWTSSLKQLLRHSIQEIQSLFYMVYKPKRKVATNRTLTYYELMNVSLKYLIRLNGVNLKKINFNRPTYRLLLLCILFLFPLYSYFTVFFPRAPTSAICPGDSIWYDDGQNDWCKWYNLYLVVTLYATVPCMLNILFGSGVLIGLVSLAYGCEIAYRLTHVWIHRFKGLHRVEVTSGEVLAEESAETDSKYSQLTHEKSKHLSEIIKESNDYMDANDKKLSEKNEIASPLSKEEQLLDVIPLISVDARERYMFMREFMNQAGRVWSLGVLGLICIFLFIAVVGIYFIDSSIRESQIRLGTSLVIKFFMIVCYPIVSIAHANSFVFELRDMFTIAADEDYSVIGGKAKWIPLLSVAPAVWSVFGVWVTYDKLFAILWAAISTVFAIGVAILTSRL